TLVKTRACPDLKIACAKTMSTSRLTARNDEASVSKEARVKSELQFGFLITSDGWRSCEKRNYQNYIFVSVEGPIFLNLVETTAESGAREDVEDGFEKQFDALSSQVRNNIVLGQTSIGCAAHEVSLLFKEWVKKTPDIFRVFNEGLRVVRWVNNHSEILKLFNYILPGHFNDKRKHCITLYSPGDTRMATVFKMLFRIRMVHAVLEHLASAKIEFDRWRASSAIFPSEVWDAADKYHAYQWSASFSDDFAHLRTIAKRVLAQAHKRGFYLVRQTRITLLPKVMLQQREHPFTCSGIRWKSE
ncbi:MAG: hypothetical protein SGPRY_002043, partial [Prymnesium sp.]